MAKNNKHNLTARAAYTRLWRDWLKPFQLVLAFTFLLMIIGALSSAGYAKFMEYVIAAFETSSASVIWWGPLGIIFLSLSKGISKYIQLYLQNKVLSRVQAQMQNKMYSSLVYMDLSNLLAESPAALASRFSADIDLVNISTREVLAAITAILTILAAFCVMLSIDWAMTFGLVLIFSLAFGPVGVIGARVRKISTHTQEEIARMTELINEGLTGIRMVRTYRLENRMTKAANITFERLYSLRVKLMKWLASVSPLMEILGGLAVGALLFLVAFRMRSGAIDLAGFIGMLTALGVATNPARKLGSSYAVALQGLAALDRIYTLFDTPNTIKDGAFEFANDDRAKGRLEFNNLSFTYPDGYTALHNLNLTIEPGKSYAFVGRSGAGKSTVFNLLPRLFDVTSGEIKLDGRALHEYNISSLRDQISVVSQDSVLLSGSIIDNIGFGREDASREDCIRAAKAAASHSFISKLEDGYDTEIDPSQITFSGGERQRLSIARAILRDAPILLLDEPTSALDAQSESLIRDALDKLSEGKTTLIIAHRLATILDADQIVVMDQGRIVDQGTHEELLERGGIYSELFNLQFDLSPSNTAIETRRPFESGSKWKAPFSGLARFLGI